MLLGSFFNMFACSGKVEKHREIEKNFQFMEVQKVINLNKFEDYFHMNAHIYTVNILLSFNRCFY